MTARAEPRAEMTGTSLTGYASVFGIPYRVREKGRTFDETVAPGAFKRSLSNPDVDVQLLVNHAGLPLARTKSGTMTLTEDAKGLLVRAELDASDPDVQALKPKILRGDLSEMSFAFIVRDETWSPDKSQRTLHELDVNRGDVSLVTYGASPTTSVYLRGDRRYEMRRLPLVLRDGSCARCGGEGTVTLTCPLCGGDDGDVESNAARPVAARVPISAAERELRRLIAQRRRTKTARLWLDAERRHHA